MIQTLYSASTGMITQQKNIDTISSNVANINSDGYKKRRFDFQDALYTRMRTPSPIDNVPEQNLMRGHGSIEYQTKQIFFQGGLKESGRLLDFAIEGQGFFAVENPTPSEDVGNGDGEEISDAVLYTRGGNMYVSPTEEGNFLADSKGRFFLDEDGERIPMPEMQVNLACDKAGNLSYVDSTGENVSIGKLQFVDFVNPEGLANFGDNCYTMSENSGEFIEAKGVILQGYNEGSNVDYAEETTRLIRAQRAYQMAARCISTADQMMQLTNSIRS